MSNLPDIILQLKNSQSGFLQKLELIEQSPENASEEVLRDLIQDAREIHEGTVLLSYLAYHDEEIEDSSVVGEVEVLPFEQASQQAVSAGDFMTEEEISEEDELMNALDQAIEQTQMDVERTMPEPEIVNEINAVKDIIEEEEKAQVEPKVEMVDEIPTQEELNVELESSISNVISMHSADTSLADRMNVEDNSLAAQLAKKKIENLVTAIGINEKFLFTNELFGGNTEQFLKEINVLNEQLDKESAIGHLNSLADSKGWDKEMEPFQKLTALVNRKFV